MDIIDIKVLQNSQNFFAKTMDIALCCISKNGHLTKPSNLADFCFKYRENACCKDCQACQKHYCAESVKSKQIQIYKCPMDVTFFAFPISIRNEHFAYIVGGQVLTEYPKEEDLKKTIKKFSLNEDEFFEEMSKLKIVPVEKLKAFSNLLFAVSNAMAEIAYANYELSELGLDYKIPRKIDFEKLFFLNCDKIKRPITGREFEVLKLLVLGKSNAEIAKELCISIHTVKAHVSSILEKFLVEDRVQVAVKAVKEGIV